jgi:hypothetical protein
VGASSEQFVIRLGMNSSGVTSGVNSAVGQIQRLYEGTKKVVEGFLALESVHWAGEQVRSAIELGVRLNNLADRSDQTVESLQGLQFGAKKAGVEIDDIVRGIKDMSRAQIDAIKGNAELRASFSRYGITLNDLRTKKPSDLFNDVAVAMGRAQSTAQVTDDAAQIFGKAGDLLLPAFRNGLIESAEEAKKLGIILERDVTDELSRAGDEIDLLNAKWKTFEARVVATGLKKLTGFIRDTIDAQVAQSVEELAKQAGGNTTIAKNIASVLASAVIAIEKGKEKAADDADEEQRKKRGKQGAPGDVTKATSSVSIGSPIASDSLLRVGGIRGGSGELSRVQNRQLEVQLRIEGHLRRIADSSDKIAKSEEATNGTARDPWTRLRDYYQDFDPE